MLNLQVIFIMWFSRGISILYYKVLFSFKFIDADYSFTHSDLVHYIHLICKLRIDFNQPAEQRLY